MPTKTRFWVTYWRAGRLVQTPATSKDEALMIAERAMASQRDPSDVQITRKKPMVSVVDQLDHIQKVKEQGDWIPASGGTETPFFTRTGRRLLYCWQQSTGRHAYLDMGTDTILSDEEARLALAT